jgi:hypothetical protein
MEELEKECLVLLTSITGMIADGVFVTFVDVGIGST